MIVKITGLKPGTAHIGHIHGGNWVTLTHSTIFYNLEPVVANGSGKGMSKTEIPEGLEGLADYQWWGAFHEGAENPVPPLPQTPALAVGPVIIKGQAD